MIAYRNALILCLALLTACGLPPRRFGGEATDCHSAKRESTPYEYVSKADDEHVPPGAFAVRASTRTPAATRLAPCSVLRVKKKIVLQRDPRTALVLKEVQEFYAEDGTLIARHVKDVSRELTRSGTYAGELILPIPERAPVGRYRIVLRLVSQAARRMVPLSQASLGFRVAGAPPAARTLYAPGVPKAP